MNVPFDPAATPGEVRIFADAPRPFVALVVEEHGLLGRTVVPVSPHPAPVSGRELALGELRLAEGQPAAALLDHAPGERRVEHRALA